MILSNLQSPISKGASLNCQNFTTTAIEIGASGKDLAALWYDTTA